MEKLEYKIAISAPVKKVWETMLRQESYRQWVGKSWPDSFYQGRWEQGEEIRFTGPDGSGTLAELVEVKPYEKVLARHIAILGPGGKEDRTSELAKGWIGITEEYRFVERDGQTTVMVTLVVNPEWKEMFDEGWPTALQELKKIAEGQMAAV